MSFFTALVGIIAASASSFTGLRTDNFNGGILPATWTFYQPPPNDDGAYSVVSNQLVIDCPEAPQGGNDGHDLYQSGIQAPHLVQQNEDDADFDVNTKLQSLPTEQYQINGFVIKTSLTTFLRVGYYYGASGNLFKFFIASYTGSTEVVYLDINVTGSVSVGVKLRVRRVGNVFTVFKWDAAEGDTEWVQATEFTYAMTVNEVGLVSGNVGIAGVAPQFDAVYEYFAIENDPPS